MKLYLHQITSIIYVSVPLFMSPKKTYRIVDFVSLIDNCFPANRTFVSFSMALQKRIKKD